MRSIIGPYYDPPYESPIEDLFAYNLVKYLDRSVDLEKQVWIETICGKFRLDFLATNEKARVAFECDGQQFHNPTRDEWRDAMILGTGFVDTIYRIRGADINLHEE